MQQRVMWRQGRWSLLIFGGLELAAAYGMGSLALDNGALWEYVAGIILCVGGVRNIVKLVRNVFHGHQAAKA